MKIYTVGQAANDTEKQKLQKFLDEYNVARLRLELVQLNVSPDEFNQLSSDVQTNLAEKLNLLQTVEDKQKKKVENLQTEITNLKENFQPDKSFLNDAKWIFPEIADVSWQKITTDNTTDSSNQIKTLLMKFKENIRATVKNSVNERILRLAQSRFADTRFRVAEQELPKKEAEESENQGQINTNTNNQ